MPKRFTVYFFLYDSYSIVLQCATSRVNWNIPRRHFLTDINRKESQGREAFILPFTLFSIYAPLVRRRKYSLEPFRPWLGGGGGL